MATFGKYVNWGHTAYFSEVAGLGTTEGIDSTGWRTYTTWETDSNPAVPADDLYTKTGQIGEAIGLAKHLAQTRQPAGMRTRLMYRGFFIDVENQTRNIKVIPKGVKTGSEHLGAMIIPVNDTDYYVFALDEYVYSNGLPYGVRLKVFFVNPVGETEVDMAGFPPMYLYSTYSGTLDYRWPTGFTYITPGADRLVLVAGISVFNVPNQNGLYASAFGVLYNGALTIAQPGPPPPQAEWTDLSTRLRSLGPGPTPGSAVAIFESLSHDLVTKGLATLSVSPEGGAAYTDWQPLPQVYGQGIVQYGNLLRRVNVSEYVQVGWEPRYVGERYVDIGGATEVISQYMADFYMTNGPLTARVPLVSIPYELPMTPNSEMYNIPTSMSLERNTVLVAASTITHAGLWAYSRKSYIITFHDADIEKGIDFGWTISPGPTMVYDSSETYGPLGDGRFFAALYTVDYDLGGYSDVRLVAFNRDVPLWTLVCPPYGGVPGDGIVVGSGELVIYVHTYVETGFDSTGEGTINNSYTHTTHLTLYYITDEGPTAVVDFSNTDNSYITAQILHLSSTSVVCMEASVIHFGGGPEGTIDHVNKRVVTFFNFRTGVVVRAEVPTVNARADYRTEKMRVSDTSFVWTVWAASGPETGSTPDYLVRGSFTHMFSCVVGDEIITQEIGVAEYTGYAGAAFVASEVSPFVSVQYQNSGPAAGPATIVFDNGVYQVYSKEATEVSEDPDFLYYSVQRVGGPYDQAADGFSARTVMRITKDLTYIWPEGLVDANPLAPFIQRG